MQDARINILWLPNHIDLLHHLSCTRIVIPLDILDEKSNEVFADNYCIDIPSLDSDEEAIASEQSQSATPGSPNTVEASFSDDDIDAVYFEENYGENRSNEQSNDGASVSFECEYSCDGSGDGCTRDFSQDSLPSWFARFGSNSLPHLKV
ncbi:hypothetical protein MRX96_029770 [Rhipicephalus microplus]